MIDDGRLDVLTIDDDSACGECTVCRRIVRGAHPDVMTIEPGENGSIKMSRSGMPSIRAVSGVRRAAARDDSRAGGRACHPAQNALLKTLEEPLPASVFVLVTSRPDTLLPTLQCRCAHLRFGRLQVVEVASVLERSHGYSHTDALTRPLRPTAASAARSISRPMRLREARSDAENLLQVAGRDPRTRLEHAKELLKGSGTPAAERDIWARASRQ